MNMNEHPQCKTSYLNIGKINIVLLKEANKFPEVLFCWVVVTTIRPYSLKIYEKNIVRNTCRVQVSYICILFGVGMYAAMNLYLDYAIMSN